MLLFWSAGALSAGWALLQVVVAARSEAPPQLKPSEENNRERLGALLGSLGGKSRRERLEAAYDGAVEAHDVGFPRR